ncbi:MAG: LITAF-like zinc ribbon domain-containing protein [Chloroflexi bacterium]|nr:LITAF-like zinc ribbon domain-containing protein [Chloroflexota bacterium]
MNPIDLEKFNHAVTLVNLGRKPEAYQQMRELANNYSQDPNILLWLGLLTPNGYEARQIADTLNRIDPSNPGIAQLQQHINQTWPAPPAPPPYQPPAYQQPTYQQPTYQQPAYQQPVYQQPAVVYQQPVYIQAGTSYCPFCHTNVPPRRIRRISSAGWVVFTLLLLFTVVFCWIGLLMKEEVMICSTCGMRIQ